MLTKQLGLAAARFFDARSLFGIGARHFITNAALRRGVFNSLIGDSLAGVSLMRVFRGEPANLLFSSQIGCRLMDAEDLGLRAAQIPLRLRRERFRRLGVTRYCALLRCCG